MRKNIKEYGDLGSFSGNPANSTGLVSPGLSTYSSPDTAQNPVNLYTAGRNVDPRYNVRAPVGVTDGDIESIKDKVTPDEVICGMDYELKRLFYKNKDEAKSRVIHNLRQNPKYYSSLGMLNMSDEPINESPIRTKKDILADIFKDIRTNMDKPNPIRVVDSRVVDAYKETVARINKKRNYGTGI